MTQCLKNIVGRLLLTSTVLSITLMTGCIWTPTIETKIVDGPQGSVSLVTVSDETFTPNHPAVLDPKVVARILRGIQVKHRIGVLQIPFGGAKGPERVFSDEQIEYLTPHIIHAFSKVTQEEQVIFRVRDHHSFGERGGMEWGFCYQALGAVPDPRVELTRMYGRVECWPVKYNRL